MKILRVTWPLVAVFVGVLGCGKGGGGGGDNSDDPAEAAVLRNLEEPAEMTDAEYDQAFPLEEPIPPQEYPTITDPTDGLLFDSRYGSFTTTRKASDHFVTTADEGVPADVIAKFERGVLFGLEYWSKVFADFDLHAATSGNQFYMHIHRTPHETVGARANVQYCYENEEDLLAECVPRINWYYVDPDPKVESANTFVHEVGHVGFMYYQRSGAATDKGGIRDGASKFSGYSWMHESSATFVAARSPDDEAYTSIIGSACPFVPMQLGALDWRNASSVGDLNVHPYQLSIFVDQVSFHQFGGETEWMFDWWSSQPDRRDGSRAESALAGLIRAFSPTSSSRDFAAFNRLLVKAGYDLYFRGRNPWTTKLLRATCFLGADTNLSAAAAGSATFVLPLFSFNAVRIPIESGALDAMGALEVTLVADRPGVLGIVHAVETNEYALCAQFIGSSNLDKPNPRSKCNTDHVVQIGALEPGNGFAKTLKLDAAMRQKLAGKDIVVLAFHTWRPGAPQSSASVTARVGPPAPKDLVVTVRNSSSEEHVHFSATTPTTTGSATADRGSTSQMTLTGVSAGDEIQFRAEKPSDFGPVAAGSTTCTVSDNPTNPTVSYSGGLSCSGF